jgi:hypothetical protein
MGPSCIYHRRRLRHPKRQNPHFYWFSEVPYLSWNVGQNPWFFHHFKIWPEILSVVTAVCKFLSVIFTAAVNTQRNFWQWSQKTCFSSLTPWCTYHWGVCVCPGGGSHSNFGWVFCKGRVLCSGIGHRLKKFTYFLEKPATSIFRVECSWSLWKHLSGLDNIVWIIRNVCFQ